MGHTSGAPVEIRSLAAALGIVVREGAIEEAGRLYLRGESAEVLLNRQEPEERRRFTLAHETSHWLLHRPVHDEACVQVRDIYDSEEYLCDKIAGAILMPRSWVARFRGRPRTLATVVEVADSAEVSLSAALVRLRDVLRWRSTLYQWRREGREWVFDGEAGLFPAQQALLRTIEATREELGRVAAQESGFSAEGLPVSLGYEERRVNGEVSVNRSAQRAVALLCLPDPGRGTAGAGERLAWRRARVSAVGTHHLAPPASRRS